MVMHWSQFILPFMTMKIIQLPFFRGGSLFSGVGGLGLGLKKNVFSPIALQELWEHNFVAEVPENVYRNSRVQCGEKHTAAVSVLGEV